MCPRKGQGKGSQSRNCFEDVKEWVPPPFFFVQLLEQQPHQSPAFCCPHIQQSFFHILPTIGLETSYHLIHVTCVQYSQPLCGIHPLKL